MPAAAAGVALSRRPVARPGASGSNASSSPSRCMKAVVSGSTAASRARKVMARRLPAASAVTRALAISPRVLWPGPCARAWSSMARAKRITSRGSPPAITCASPRNGSGRLITRRDSSRRESSRLM